MNLTLRVLLLLVAGLLFIEEPSDALAQTLINVVPTNPTTKDVVVFDISLASACPSLDWVSVVHAGNKIRIDINYPVVPPPAICPSLLVTVGELQEGPYVAQVSSAAPGIGASIIASSTFFVKKVVATAIPTVTTSTVAALILLIVAIAMRARHRPAAKNSTHF